MNDRVKGTVRSGWLVTGLWCMCIVLLGAVHVEAQASGPAVVVNEDTVLPLGLVVALCMAAIAATYKSAMTLARIDARLSRLEEGGRQDARGNGGAHSGGDEGFGGDDE